MKRHTGEGVGGVIAVVICLFVGLVNPFLLSHEVGQLYSRRGQEPPVTALTGLWFFPGMFILVGPFIWFDPDQPGAQRVLAEPGPDADHAGLTGQAPGEALLQLAAPRAGRPGR